MAALLESVHMVWLERTLHVAGTLLGLYLSVKIIAIINNVRRMKAVVGDMPGPTPVPLLGNTLELLARAEDFWPRMMNMVNAHAPTFRFWLGPNLFVVVTDPRDYEFIMNNPKWNTKSPWYPLAAPALGTGLIVLNGDPWRRHRKAVTPSFHQKVLDLNVDVFRRKAENMAGRLGALADSGETFDIKEHCNLVSMDAVCETLLSADLSEHAAALKHFVDEKNRVCDLVVYRFYNPWLLNSYVFSWTKVARETERIEQLTNQFIDRVIKEKRVLSAERTQKSDPESPSGRRRALLEHLLEDPGVPALMSDLELREEAKAMVIAGEGTSANTMSFALFMLAMYPDVQDKVYQELVDTFGTDPARPVTAAELPHLEYLERVLMETLRLFPIVSAFARGVPEDSHLPSGYSVPRGAHVVFISYQTHRDPAWYPNPHDFDPDRFLPDAVRERPATSFVAFSAGPRSCIGKRYAMMLMKTVLATVLRRYRVLRAPDDKRTVAELPVEIGVILTIRGGFNVRVERR